MLREQKGITLIALIITIIVLIILAGVSISLLVNENDNAPEIELITPETENVQENVTNEENSVSTNNDTDINGIV